LVVDWKDGDTEAARSRRSRIRIRTSSPFRVQQPVMVLLFVSRPPRLARDPDRVRGVRVHNLQFYFREGENFERAAFNSALGDFSFHVRKSEEEEAADPPSWIATSPLY